LKPTSLRDLPKMLVTHLKYKERADYCLSTVAKNLLKLMDEKKTNLAFSADVTHIDIISDYTPELTHELHKLALKHRFLIFEDRKFADIGNTVKLQYEGGIYQIADWADIINAHILPGPGIVQGLADVGRKQNRGLILLAEMSSAGHMMNQEYIKNTMKIAEQFADFVIGFITQHSLSADPHWINFTPGIKLESGFDALGQQYITPEVAVTENGSDVIIVGRGIITAENPVTEAHKYRERGWYAYLNRCR
jgi:uridine monophosphate synthetase